APKTQLYTVKKEETHTAIALKYKTTVSNLKNTNNIANPNLIFIGKKLKVPMTPLEVQRPTKESSNNKSNSNSSKLNYLRTSENRGWYYDGSYG
ncbi:LysM peptidoglycan-binding domain-containing protein, partial [Staphylococcus aureus]